MRIRLATTWHGTSVGTSCNTWLHSQLPDVAVTVEKHITAVSGNLAVQQHNACARYAP